MLVERTPNALHAAPAYLLVGELRIDHSPAVLRHPVLEQADETRVGIDLHVGAVDAVGEDVEVVDQPGTTRMRKDRLHAARQLADLVMADATDLGECQAFHAVRTINDEPVDDVERAGLGLRSTPARSRTSCRRSWAAR